MRKVFTRDITAGKLRLLMKKPAFDEVVLNEEALNRIQQIFGRKISALEVVDKIVTDVRKNGDAALFHYCKLLDGTELDSQNIAVSESEFAAAMHSIDADLKTAIGRAIDNVRQFHQEQRPKSWLTYREHGAVLGQCCLPLDRVGIYVPGGKAAYPSSVIMNAIPASVAGVKDITMVVPPSRDGGVNPVVLAAARLAGVTTVLRIGGAQAIAALAFGTESVPRVDKITGPGNIFVTLAKKAVYGHCDIDMLAGPSEILIIADNTANPGYVAADMLSQAEHDELASSILLTDSSELAAAVEKEITRQLSQLPRQNIAGAALANNGLIVVTEDINQAVELANSSAPEHLEILTAEPFKILPHIRHAGAIFLGPYSPEPIGDYIAGPNHVLPTGGTARYYSVLNVETFMKKTSMIAYTKEALSAVSNDVIRLAEAEGLQAHAGAIRIRGEH